MIIERKTQHLEKSQIPAVNAQANQLNDINAERPQYSIRSGVGGWATRKEKENLNEIQSRLPYMDHRYLGLTRYQTVHTSLPLI